VLAGFENDNAVKSAKSFNIGLMADAVWDATIRMGYQDSSSPTPVAYRRGCGHFAGKPLALGECDFTQA
jgi:hypothetical protein